MSSEVWKSFESSEYAKKVVASPKSAPGDLASVSWQSGNGNVPDCTKTHDLKEVQKAIEDVATKAPTGRVAGLSKDLAKLVKLAEAWENSNKPELQPFVSELDSIIDSTISEYAPKN